MAGKGPGCGQSPDTGTPRPVYVFGRSGRSPGLRISAYRLQTPAFPGTTQWHGGLLRSRSRGRLCLTRATGLAHSLFTCQVRQAPALRQLRPNPVPCQAVEWPVTDGAKARNRQGPALEGPVAPVA